MPHRTNRRGTYVLDRQFRGLGRLKRASGTSDVATHRQMDAMLTTLYRGGRLDMLRAIRRGTLTPMEVWEEFRVLGLDQLPPADQLLSLDRALGKWVQEGGRGKSAAHRRDRKYQVAALLRVAKPEERVRDLPAILRRYRDAAEGAPMFNRTRACVLAYLRDTAGRRGLWSDCRDVEALPERRAVAHGLDPVELRERLDRLPDRYRTMAWDMVTTGMGRTEYWGRWDSQPPALRIHGTKRESRDRRVPLVRPPMGPRSQYPAFLRALKAHCGLTPHALRRTYSHLLELAGIHRTRRRLYMGHGAKDTTDLYEEHELRAYLAEDAIRLRRVLGLGDGAALRLVEGA